MSSAAVYDDIHDHLVANFTAAPLVFENEPWPEQDTPAAFVFIEIFGDFYAQESFGSPGQNLWRETGSINMHVIVPNDTGTRDARMLARQLVALFREVEVSGIRFRDMAIGAGEPGEEKSNYYRMTATVDFERDD